MPHLAEQHTQMPGSPPCSRCCESRRPLKMSYEAAKKRAEPYTKIVEELPQMRQERVQALAEMLRG